jgi:hypothetical protein
MTTPSTFTKTRVLAGLMIATLAVIIYPETSSVAHASEGNQSLIFELKPNALSKDNQSGLSIDEVITNDELASRVRQYLENKKSPLAPYAYLIVRQQNWEQAMGIIYVESNYCSVAANFNCGSVGVKPGHKQWKKFENPFDGFKAVTELLDKPLYKDHYDTCKEKIGVYVVPGSTRWLRGCEQVEKEMKNLSAQAEQERQSKLASLTAHSTNVINKELALAK